MNERCDNTSIKIGALKLSNFYLRFSPNLKEVIDKIIGNLFHEMIKTSAYKQNHRQR